MRPGISLPLPKALPTAYLFQMNMIGTDDGPLAF